MTGQGVARRRSGSSSTIFGFVDSALEALSASLASSFVSCGGKSLPGQTATFVI